MFSRRMTALAGASALVFGLGASMGARADEAALPMSTGDASSVSASSAPISQAEALNLAEASGQQVEVTSERSEYGQVFADPGGLLMSQISAVPVFGHDAEGALVPIDTTLQVRADGTVAPAAAAADVVFPAAGSDGVISLSYSGRVLDLTIPGTLPTPQLDGSTATYPDVYPGVDLQLTATAEGFQELLVVKSREAANDAQLNELVFHASTQRATLRHEAGGGFAVVDPWGSTVFSAGRAFMWDSSGDATGEAGSPDGLSMRATSVDSGGQASGPTSAVSAEATDDAADGDVATPGPGDTWATVPVAIGSSTMSVTPSQDLLDDPDTTYPVYIDPAPGLNNTSRMRLRSDNQNIWQFTGEQGMGKCPISYDSSCSSAYVNRLYFTFPRSAAAANNQAGLHTNTKVIDAEFRDTETWSANCTAHNVKLVQTSAVNSGTKWGGPTNLKTIQTISAAHGYNSSCPDAMVKFSNSTLIGLAQQLADSTITSLTLSLQASDETDQLAWKRFDDGAQLQIWYRVQPDVPTNVGYQVSSTTTSTTCRTTVGTAAVVDNQTPAFHANLRTTNSLVDESDFRAQFQVQHADTSDSPMTWINQWGDGNFPAAPTDYSHGNGFPTTLTSPTLPKTVGLEYRMHARTQQSWSIDGTTGTNTSAWSAWCYFFIDPDSPAKPTLGLDLDQNSDGVVEHFSDAALTGASNFVWPAVGVGGRFTIMPAQANDPTFDHFAVDVTPPVGNQTHTNTSGSFIFTPARYGSYTLEFSSYDSLGRSSKSAVVHIGVPSPAANIADWAVVATDTTSVADTAPTSASAPNTGPLTLSGAVSVSVAGTGRRGMLPDAHDDPFDSALSFTGTGTGTGTGQAVSPTRAFDPNQSFTAMAWVKLADTSSAHVAFAETSTDNSYGYEVGYDPTVNGGAGGWTVTMHSAVGGTQTIVSTAPATVGVWTHLTVTRTQAQTFPNPIAARVTLAVDGRVASQTVSPPSVATDATTRFLVGHGGPPTLASATSPFHGAVDEIRVWGVALDPDEAFSQSIIDPTSGQSLLSKVADWQADPADSTGLKDESLNQQPDLVSSGAAVLNADATAFTLDGTSGSLQVNRPMLDETSPFTVSVTLTPNAAAMASASGQTMFRLLGQAATVSGGGHDSWALWFEKTGVTDGLPDGRWVLGRWSAPGSTATPVRVEYASNSTNFDLTDEVTLNATYEPTQPGDPSPDDMQVCLSAGSARIGCVEYGDPSQGSGALTVGKAPTGVTPAWGQWLPADISRVAVFAGAASPDQLVTMVPPGS